MADSKTIQTNYADGVARLTLARPKHNVFNIAMMQELNTALESLIAESNLKCVVILGEGPSWCAGVDVGDHKPELVDIMITTFNRIFELIEAIPVPVIAAVHGACLGGGMEVAIACDMVVAAKKPSLASQKSNWDFSRRMRPFVCLSWWGLPRPLKSAPPVKPIQRMRRLTWDLLPALLKMINLMRKSPSSSEKSRPVAP